MTVGPLFVQLDLYVHTLGKHLKARFGQRVHKLSLHADFTCPNRDGTLGRGGCTFCNVASFSDESAKPLAQQLAEERDKIGRARRYLAYFQSYTNTYAEVEQLRRLYEEALAAVDMVGLCVGTRPDCVPDPVLDLLAGYRQAGKEVWLELGLQSANDATLERVNRGHGFAAYADAVQRARLRQIPVCTHLVVGLPGEAPEESLVTLERVLEAGVEGLKIHPLMLVKGSRLAAPRYREGVALMSQEAYIDLAVELIRRTPDEVVFHRVAATAKPPTLIGPAWCQQHLPVINAIAAELARRGPQGSART